MDPCLKAVSYVFSVLEIRVDAKFRKQGNQSKRNFIKKVCFQTEILGKFVRNIDVLYFSSPRRKDQFAVL